VEGSKTMAGDGLGITDRMGDDVERGIFASMWQRLLQAALRLRADISFAVVDVFIIVAGYTMATALRMLDGAVENTALFWNGLGRILPVLVLVHLLANLFTGTYGHVWEYASISEARRVILSNIAAAGVIVLLVTPIFDLVDPGRRSFPYGVAVVGSILVLLGMGLVRFRSRLFSLRRSITEDHTATLVVGDGKAAADFVREVHRLGQNAEVIGFVSPEKAATHRRLAGLSILGSLNDLPTLVKRHSIQQVIVAGEVESDLIRRVVDVCTSVDVRLRVAPGAGSVLDGQETPIDIRDIEFQDLLPRPEIDTDLGSVEELVKGRRVMVTGAGGSIGSEIVKQVLAFEPAAVIALDNDETHLHETILRVGPAGAAVRSVLCDIRDAEKLNKVMAANAPEVVFHAAALKHVPVLEAFPEEAVFTNVLGTRNVIDAVSRVGADRFVLISTDKAVEPSSVMGATKRIAEMLTQVANKRRDGCVYSCVRFGNVLGSRGSVVPTFVHQIHSGGPVTITDPAMTRFFMTVPEAVQLVLQAATLAEGGEVFVLDMGEPVKVMDLARRMIRLAGLVPGRDIEVAVTGIRPGEKLYEILSEVPLQPSSHPKINLARPQAPGSVTLTDAVRTLESLARNEETRDLIDIVKGVAAMSQPEEVVDLREIEADHAGIRR
jgi:FlaA1/EpsC-like NDP-sugar epimerase